MEARHILLADDNPLLLRSLEVALKDEGHRVGTARNGEEAMAYICKCQPDVAVLDIFMPVMDGLETLLSIRKEYPGLRTIMVSGGGSSDRDLYLSMVSKLGADAILQKPFTAGQLIEKLFPER